MGRDGASCGLVDSWGEGEFCYIFPRVLAFIRSGAVGG